MDLVTIYKENETVETYETIYFNEDKYEKNPPELGYRILRIIGNGVYGVVYKAECLDDNKIVAMKQTYQRNANIFKEIEIMKKLKHPNIVELKHAFYTTTSNGFNVHMIMEYGNIDLSAALNYITLNSTTNIIHSEKNSSNNNNNKYPVNENGENKGEFQKKKEQESNEGITMNTTATTTTTTSSSTTEEEKDLFNSEKKETKQKFEKKTLIKQEEKEEEKKKEDNKKDGKKMLSSSGESKGGKKEKEEEHVQDKESFIECQRNNKSPNKCYLNDLNKSINNICSYHNLNDYIKKNYFNPNQIKIYIYQLIRATLYLHSLSITHRDIKPQNILIFQNDSFINGSANSQFDENECLVCIQNKFEKNFILYSKNKNRLGNDDKGIEPKSKIENNEECKKKETDKNRIVTNMHLDAYNDNNVFNGDHNSNNGTRTTNKTFDTCINKDDINGKKIPNENGIGITRVENVFLNEKQKKDPIINMTTKEYVKIDATDCHFANVEATINRNGSKTKQDPLQNKENISIGKETPKRTACKGNITFKYIKLCDFNTSIKLKENFKYFSYICSRYYRAPELLFGSNYYTQAIDTWSIGCVMGELILGKPLFLGECASDQLVEIIKVLGTPNDEDFLSFRSVYKDVKFPDIKPITLKKVISQNCSKDSIDLLGKLLQFNPKKRIKLCQALLHNYFDDIRNLKAFEIFDKANNSDIKYSYSFNTNCFNFTKEELLHFTVEERKILIPSEVREKKFDEVKQYIHMSIENFDRLYPNSLYVS